MQPKITTSAIRRRDFLRGAILTGASSVALMPASRGLAFDTLELMTNEGSLQRELTGGNDLYYETEVHRDPDTYFGFPVVREYKSMLIEPSIYLSAPARTRNLQLHWTRFARTVR
jgi:hypothetical protein